MTNQPRFAIIYGRTDFFAEVGLTTIFVSDAFDVRKMARQFIKVIPDELDGYNSDIDMWDGTDVLKLTHQDDDTFLFQATPIKMTDNTSGFDGFVSEFIDPDYESDI